MLMKHTLAFLFLLLIVFHPLTLQADEGGSFSAGQCKLVTSEAVFSAANDGIAIEGPTLLSATVNCNDKREGKRRYALIHSGYRLSSERVLQECRKDTRTEICPPFVYYDPGALQKVVEHSLLTKSGETAVDAPYTLLEGAQVVTEVDVSGLWQYMSILGARDALAKISMQAYCCPTSVD